MRAAIIAEEGRLKSSPTIKADGKSAAGKTTRTLRLAARSVSHEASRGGRADRRAAVSTAMRCSAAPRLQVACCGLIAAEPARSLRGLTTAIKRLRVALSLAAARHRGISTRKVMATAIALKALIEGRPTAVQEVGLETGYGSRLLATATISHAV